MNSDEQWCYSIQLRPPLFRRKREHACKKRNTPIRAVLLLTRALVFSFILLMKYMSKKKKRRRQAQSKSLIYKPHALLRMHVSSKSMPWCRLDSPVFLDNVKLSNFKDWEYELKTSDHVTRLVKDAGAIWLGSHLTIRAISSVREVLHWFHSNTKR
jgi:hypothetical protein